MESQKTIVGVCPLCGGNVIKIGKGFKCENALSEQPSCSFELQNVYAKRQMMDSEIGELLVNRELLVDGLTTKDGKTFSALLKVNPSGSVDFFYDVSVCPVCGGSIKVNAKAFGCSNFNNPLKPCKFTIWRNQCAHFVSLKEARQICENGITSEAVAFWGEKGDIYFRKLALSPEKDQIVKVQ